MSPCYNAYLYDLLFFSFFPAFNTAGCVLGVWLWVSWHSTRSSLYVWQIVGEWIDEVIMIFSWLYLKYLENFFFNPLSLLELPICIFLTTQLFLVSLKVKEAAPKPAADLKEKVCNMFMASDKHRPLSWRIILWTAWWILQAINHKVNH